MTDTQQFILELKKYRDILTKQQLHTLKGQALSGNIQGARTGLKRLVKDSASIKCELCLYGKKSTSISNRSYVCEEHHCAVYKCDKHNHNCIACTASCEFFRDRR